MNRSGSSETVFRYWLLQHITGAVFVLACAGTTTIILAVAIAQKSLLGFFLAGVSVAITVGWAYLQYFFWTTQAWSVTVTLKGIYGKPLLSREVSLAWEDLCEVVSTPVGFIRPPQIELRGRSGISLRVSFMMPRRDQFLELLRTRAPHCRFAIKYP